MKTPKALDPFTIPLQGKHLIEASAGTGKTYTLTILFIRLLIEARKPIHSILVVTFTKVAASELKERIYQTLIEARYLFSQEKETVATDFLQNLYDSCQDKKQALNSIKQALISFDESSIYTIHGFCQKVLQENAFACKEFFQVTLQEDITDTLKQVVSDYWTQQGYAISSIEQQCLLQEKETPASLFYLAKTYLSYKDKQITLIGEPKTQGLTKLYKQVQAQRKILQANWQSERTAIYKAITSDSLRKVKSKDTWIQELDDYFAEDRFSLALPKNLAKFTTEYITASVKKNCVPPEHSFFTQTETFIQLHATLQIAISAWKVQYRKAFLNFAVQSIDEYKKKEKVWFFDDLLTKVAVAMSSQGNRLCTVLQKEYEIGLIDEFQDTDNIQYSIFKQLFAKEDQGLFLIGDPKQAIYGFRGADIYTYLQIEEEETQLAKYSLNTNWRSDSLLVEAVNTIFLRNPAPFLIKNIDYHAVEAARTETAICDSKQNIAPIRFRINEEKNNEINMLIEDIQGLLTSNVELKDGKEVAYNDIAVLVRTNDQLLQVRDELTKARIPVTAYFEKSVFDSEEADFILLLLETIIEVKYKSSIFALLAHAFLQDLVLARGVKQNEKHVLHALLQEETKKQWEADWQPFLIRLNEIWKKHGFLATFQAFLEKTDLLSYLLQKEQGERHVTNLLHLREILYSQEKKTQGAYELIEWLKARCQDKQTKEYELRSSTSGKTVQVYTIHKSKGLEFPIVFLPFCKKRPFIAKPADPFYDTEKKERFLRLDANIPEEEKQKREQEGLAEDRRNLYVALTRAKHYLHIYLQEKEKVLTPLLAKEKSDLPTLLADLCQERSDLFALSTTWSQGEHKAKQETIPTVTQARAIQPIQRIWQYTASYSSMLRSHDVRFDKIDETPSFLVDTAIKSEPIELADFPPGAKSGLFFHAILEGITFQKTIDSQKEIIQATADQYGIDLEEHKNVYAFLENIRQTKLAPMTFSLADIKKNQLIKEMSFTLSVRLQDKGGALTPPKFATFFTSLPHAPAYQSVIAKLGFEPIKGFLEGFVDLICEQEGKYYVLDYKTNFLGRSYQDYNIRNIAKTMELHHYYIQAYVYCVALHKWLQLTLPNYSYEANFGGFGYLFLRGMEQGKEQGVYFHCPTEKEIEGLATYLTKES